MPVVFHGLNDCHLIFIIGFPGATPIFFITPQY